ncbi:MAG: molybdopterin molybdotransferase MoeA [Methanospirillum sp.]|uniref:molybdopterin molybdotransferase MoeA n=1 Tax=Methanospirillum sp. TaxID=45200 RepID=UPI00236D4621|nr:molybdopterin molybdotransferase MoeA [Methanospirillum sp.]MDD1727603.1 molybdopterin molybdotransferase MoeA [Methanospirillum sp.]
MADAKKIVFSSFQTPDTRVRIPVADSCGRVLAEPVYSKWTNPPLLLSGPDGIAVKSEATTGAGEKSGIELDAPRVNTGMPMPDGYDAVIPIEEVIEVSENKYQIHAPVSPLQNTIPCGEDIGMDDMVMDAGHQIIPFDIGALLSYGITDVLVTSWRVGLVATGDEIISPYETPKPGQIVDSNSYMIAGFLKQYGVVPVLYPVIPDDPATISRELQKISTECDMVLIFGGSSAGSKDHTVDAMEQCGTLLFHGVAMVPAKPVTLARINGKPAFGMPGPSIASLTVLREFISPLLSQWGVPIPPDLYVDGELTEAVASVDGVDMFLMVKVHTDHGKTLITPVPRIFGHMMGVRADAVLHKKRGSDKLVKGQEVEVRAMRRETIG